jgi:xylulose-5-phosphate/fructose-6-phosphate phosphoketolase
MGAASWTRWGRHPLKQPQLQWLGIDEAIEHCARGASVWRWASNDADGAPDVVLAAAGDIPTMEVVAATAWLRQRAPEMRVRVVNVVDLMTLFQPTVHPHGMADGVFVELFGRDTDVVFAFHGYQRAIHELLHLRPKPERFHVRGYIEEGTTTTPFDMVVRNGMSRYSPRDRGAPPCPADAGMRAHADRGMSRDAREAPRIQPGPLRGPAGDP